MYGHLKLLLIFNSGALCFASFRHFPTNALLRKHVSPEQHRFALLQECATDLQQKASDASGVDTVVDEFPSDVGTGSFDTKNNLQLQRSLGSAGKAVSRLHITDFKRLILVSQVKHHGALVLLKTLATRAMSEAKYFATGTEQVRLC